MSPCEIESLLWFYYTPLKHPKLECGMHITPASGNARMFLVGQGLIARKSDIEKEQDNPQEGEYSDYRITEKGAAYCKALTQVPLPVQEWKVEWPSNEDCNA